MMKNQDAELCSAVWNRKGSDNMLVDNNWVKSELVEKPQINVLKTGGREGPKPFNLVLNWAKAEWKDSGSGQYSKFRFQLPRGIEGYKRVSCISVAFTNVYSNLMPFYIGMRIDELAQIPYATIGDGGVWDQLGGTTLSDTTPTFLIDTAASYSSLVGTGLPANLKIAQGIITGHENYHGEYGVDVAGTTIQGLTVTLTGADFERLEFGALNFTPALFSFMCTLRFE